MFIYRKNSFFDNQNAFLIKKYNANIRTYLHKHDFIEMIFVVSGNGTHIIDGNKYTVTGGSVFFILSGQSHSLTFSDDAEYYNIFCTNNYARKTKLFSGSQTKKSIYDYLTDPSDNLNPIYFDTASFSHVESLLKDILTEWTMKRVFFNETIESYLKTLLLLCLRTSLEYNSKTGSIHSQNVLPHLIDYINMHYNEKISLQSIAKEYHYNAAYFGRLFKKKYTMTLNEYLSKIRIENAKDYLSSTDYSIGEISSLVGFSNTTYFYNNFKKIIGCSPKEYRSIHSK